MWRFAAILVLAVVGMVWFLSFADLMQQCALVPAFGAAVILPVALNPTRHWTRSFFLCFHLVYAASCVGAWFGSIVVDAVSRVEVFTAGLIPGLLFGTMASLGLERSWLADVESSRR